MLERLFTLETFGIKLGLENITRLCEALGHPERAYPSLHVAGTNGKGSVTAMVHAAMRAAGLSAGRYTSPHLTDLAERFVIDDAQVDRETLVDAVGDVLACIDRLRADGTLPVSPTFFEATSAVAFELFRRARVDVAAIEVGLGGRFDATNVIQPLAGAVTTIGFDHQQHLGNTLAAIAYEKAGIIKPGMTIVTGALPPEAIAVVARVAAERGATLVDTARTTRIETEMVDGRARVTITTPAATYGPVTLALRGEHQARNAAVAVGLLEAAAAAGIQVTHDAIESGLADADWPARLEVLTLESGQRVLLDAAHNVEGAQALAEYLRRWHPERPPLLVAVLRDKDVTGILDVLLPAVSDVTTTTAPSTRAMPAALLAEQIAARRPGTRVRAIDDPAAAVDALLQDADTVCVAGSIFLAGPVRDALKARAILP